MYTDEYTRWFDKQNEKVQENIFCVIGTLKQHGPMLPRPLADGLGDKTFPNLKELRIQAGGRPIRIAFMFGKNRVGNILCGEIKDGSRDKDFYDGFIKTAKKLIYKYDLDKSREH